MLLYLNLAIIHVHEKMCKSIVNQFMQLQLNQNEDFMVWMRTAAWPSFRKLWGKFERDLQVGEVIDVAISNSYNVYSFNGKKKLVLSTTTWLGGRNPTLGVSYLVVGCTSIIFAFIYFTAHHRNPRYNCGVLLMVLPRNERYLSYQIIKFHIYIYIYKHTGFS